MKLIADIGGTNARLALLDEAGKFRHIHNLLCADFKTLAEAVDHYLRHTGKETQITAAALALACPIEGDEVRLTNNEWSFRISDLKKRLGLTRLFVLNDFAALALATPHLRKDDLLEINRGMERAPDAPPAPIAVIGPGTGLGICALVPIVSNAGDETWAPLSGEGGHVTLPPRTDKESQVLAILRQRFGHVSAERVLSGPGLVNLGLALADFLETPLSATTPQDIVKEAIEGECPVCHETLSMFCAFLGTVAGDIALTLGAKGGLYLGGGILPGMKDFLLDSDFKERFHDKGRFSEYLFRIPLFLINAENPAFLGLKQILSKT